jgi:hypothetical protein
MAPRRAIGEEVGALKNPQPSPCRGAVVALLVSALALFCGCQGSDGRPIPKTYPVRGKVVDKDGAAITNAGRIEFHTPNELYHTVMGMAEPDGTFTMYTLSNDKKYDGATEGVHQVFVVLVDKRTGEENRVAVKDCTVQAGDNELTIVIDKPWP